MNVLENLTPLAAKTASGPVREILGEARPHEGSRNQSLGRINTRMRDVVQSIKDLAAERNLNQRTWRTGGKVTEDKGLARGHGDNPKRVGLLRRAVVTGKEDCKEDSSEKSIGKAEGRGCTAETGNVVGDGTGEGQERASATTF